MVKSHPPEIPILGPLQRGTTERHLVTLPGSALNDEPRPVVSITGAAPGPVLFVGSGVHGGEYPPIEAVIRLSRAIDPAHLSGTVILMPVLNLPAFWSRSMFVCPVDGVNPNRVFPGDVNGSYSEQMTHALIDEFVAHADAYLDLHGGDIPEALVPFSICRGGVEAVDVRSRELATAFGLPYLLTVSRPIQPAKGSSSYVAAAERGIPAVLAEAGGVGQLQQDAVELLTDGVFRVLAHLGMMQTRVAPAPEPVLLTAFEWVYAQHAGMFYPAVAAGDEFQAGQEIGTVGSLFGETLETVTAPAAGRVLFLTINPAVRAGGLLMGIGVA
ncbi:MAG: succinylglutamate desuccinylase/aspartoacylase family protein [Chthoniobacterales bacterium]|nr:succinylglutamate desuccinylase/aspartoacylase family protein [Chthoniobacterales bacterium]